MRDTLRVRVRDFQVRGMLNVVRNLMVGIWSIVVGWVAVVWALRKGG